VGFDAIRELVASPPEEPSRVYSLEVPWTSQRVPLEVAIDEALGQRRYPSNSLMELGLETGAALQDETVRRCRSLAEKLPELVSNRASQNEDCSPWVVALRSQDQ
jgi:hypothetical protein